MSTCGLVFRILLALLLIGYVWYHDGWRLALAVLLGVLFGVPLIVGIALGVNYLLTLCGCNA